MIDDVWTDVLGSRLLETLPSSVLADLASRHAGGDRGQPSSSDVLAVARQSIACRQEIVAAWRREHRELVEAARIVSIHSSAEHCARMLGHFGAEPILLEILTDEEGDGREMAAWILACVEPPATRRQLEELLDELCAPPARTAPLLHEQRRIVIFGGHQRDESKLAQRLFANSPFDVRWKPCSKHQGSPDDRVLEEAMCHAHAVILVTSMVSHNVMRAVKRYVQEYDIPWRAIGKATELQLRNSLAELFPDVPLE